MSLGQKKSILALVSVVLCGGFLFSLWQGKPWQDESVVCPATVAPLPTANAGCLVVETNRLLMVQQWNAKWALPGGTQELGESAQCTAYRETWEETGLKMQVNELLYVYPNGFHLFSCERLPNQPSLNAQRPFSFEVIDVAWISPAELGVLALRFKDQKNFMETHMNLTLDQN